MKKKTSVRPYSTKKCFERNLFILRLRKTGVTFVAIGEMFGISKNRVIKICQTMEKEMRDKSNEIRNQQ